MSDALWRPWGDVLARIACVMITLSATPGCGLCFAPGDCPPSGRLEIVVVNDQTGAPICDARVTATIAGFVEELPASGGCSYVQSACCRAGTYSVTVEREGFRTKVESHVELPDRSTACCQIRGWARIEVRLSST
jgi:hypothetical protein